MADKSDLIIKERAVSTEVAPSIGTKVHWREEVTAAVNVSGTISATTLAKYYGRKLIATDATAITVDDASTIPEGTQFWVLTATDADVSVTDINGLATIMAATDVYTTVSVTDYGACLYFFCTGSNWICANQSVGVTMTVR